MSRFAKGSGTMDHDAMVEDALIEGPPAEMIVFDARGGVVLCSAGVMRLMEDSPLDFRRSPGRSLMRVLAARWGGSRFVLEALRRSLRTRRAVLLQATQGSPDLQVRLHRLPSGHSAMSFTGLPDEAAMPGPERLDALTGLADRVSLQQGLAAAAAWAVRRNQPFAVLMIDLDDFKNVNDTLGHAVGDGLLRKVAERLMSAVRPSDVVARFGGDEFVVIQKDISGPGDAEALAGRVVDLIGRAYIVDGHPLNIGCSVGIAMDPLEGADAAALLKRADLALYRAKAEGRGRYAFYEPEMDLKMQAHRALEVDLRKALTLRQFEIHYQPQLNLETNRIVGCEALVRWRHPSRGLVAPTDFIPVAERTGLIVAIGEWVLRSACREAATWPSDIRIAVNLSPVQFRTGRLTETVASALRVSGLPAERLELEITEGVLLKGTEATLAILHEIRALGVGISMDDFGTGYSSLSYLRSFPFDKIKIDRSFIEDLDTSKDAEAIIRAIASLGTTLGMTTLAEGVETIEQMARLRAEGCTDVQGYLISRPIPANDLLRLIDKRQAA